MNIQLILDYLLAHQFVALLIVLPIFVVLNILLGRALANFEGAFDKTKFMLGIKKGVLIYLTIATLMGVSLILKVGEVDLVSTMMLLQYTVTVSYLIQVLTKLKELYNYKQAAEIVDREGTE